jgi:hypothetical protein
MYTFALTKNQNLMKSTKLLLLLGLITISNLFTQAQTDRKNVVGLSLFPLTFGQFTLGYERVIVDRFSILVKGGIKPSSSVNLNNFNDSKLKGWSVIPELRWYTSKSKGPLNSFYVSLFSQIQRYTLTTNYLRESNFYYDDPNTTMNDSIKLKFNSSTSGSAALNMMSFGIQLGRSWLISDRVQIDFWWFGPKFTMIGLDLGLTENGSPQVLFENGTPFPAYPASEFGQIYKEMANAINETQDPPGVDITANPKNNGINVKVETGIPLLRFGLSVGFAF